MPEPNPSRSKPFLVLLLVWTLLTAPLGFLLVAADEDCHETGYNFEDWGDFLCLDTSPYGELLLGAWIVGAAVLLALTAATGGESRVMSSCPRCGREVTAGSPTCLGCGYNLVAGR